MPLTEAAPKHTPGPWAVERQAAWIGERWAVTAPTPRPNRRYTVTVVVNHDVTDAAAVEASEADARLIAAAPDLLAAVRGLLALEGSIDPAEWTGVTGDAFRAARDAVAKAAGEG